MIRRFGGPGMHGVGGIPFVSMGGKGQNAASILFQDTFTGPNGTAITKPAHTPDVDLSGLGWSVVAGGWQLFNNQLDPTALGTCSADATQADYTLSIDAYMAGVQSIEYVLVRVRNQDTANNWAVYVGPKDNIWRIYEYAGAPVLRANGDFALAGGWHTIEIVVAGTVISATIDGGNQISFSPMATGAGRTAFALYSRSGGELFDDLLVTP